MVASAAIMACDNDDEDFWICPAVVLPAIEARVFDANTHELITERASGFVTNGQVSDSLSVCSLDGQGRALSLCGALGSGGTFYVTVSAPGYQPWDSTGVVVPRGRCGNGTASLEIALRSLAILVELPNTALQPAAPHGGQR
jgi:hypothetical protein